MKYYLQNKQAYTKYIYYNKNYLIFLDNYFPREEKKQQHKKSERSKKYYPLSYFRNASKSLLNQGWER